jgi:hypothetical protein
MVPFPPFHLSIVITLQPSRKKSSTISPAAELPKIAFPSFKSTESIQRARPHSFRPLLQSLVFTDGCRQLRGSHVNHESVAL